MASSFYCAFDILCVFAYQIWTALSKTGAVYDNYVFSDRWRFEQHFLKRMPFVTIVCFWVYQIWTALSKLMLFYTIVFIFCLSYLNSTFKNRRFFFCWTLYAFLLIRFEQHFQKFTYHIWTALSKTDAFCNNCMVLGMSDLNSTFQTERKLSEKHVWDTHLITKEKYRMR